MAKPALVVDASVGVKWFSAAGEPNVPEARAMLAAFVSGRLDLVVPELFFHEIGNALVHKANISDAQLAEALAELCDLDLGLFPINGERLTAAAQLARRAGISEYDAYYIVAASENGCPLVTSNLRHQKPGLGCRVIPLSTQKKMLPKGTA